MVDEEVVPERKSNQELTINAHKSDQELTITAYKSDHELTINAHKSDQELTINPHKSDQELTINAHESDQELTINFHKSDQELTINAHKSDQEVTINAHKSDQEFTINAHKSDQELTINTREITNDSAESLETKTVSQACSEIITTMAKTDTCRKDIAEKSEPVSSESDVLTQVQETAETSSDESLNQKSLVNGQTISVEITVLSPQHPLSSSNKASAESDKESRMCKSASVLLDLLHAGPSTVHSEGVLDEDESHIKSPAVLLKDEDANHQRHHRGLRSLKVLQKQRSWLWSSPVRKRRAIDGDEVTSAAGQTEDAERQPMIRPPSPVANDQEADFLSANRAGKSSNGLGNNGSDIIFIRPPFHVDNLGKRGRLASISVPNFPCFSTEDMTQATTRSLSSRGSDSLCRHVSFRTPQDDPSLVRIFSSEDPDLFPSGWNNPAEVGEDEEEKVRMSWFCLRRH